MSCNCILRYIAQLYIPHVPFIDSARSIYRKFLRLVSPTASSPPSSAVGFLPSRPTLYSSPLRQISNSTSVSRHQLFTNAYLPAALTPTRPSRQREHKQTDHRLRTPHVSLRKIQEEIEFCLGVESCFEIHINISN